MLVNLCCKIIMIKQPYKTLNMLQNFITVFIEYSYITQNILLFFNKN